MNSGKREKGLRISAIPVGGPPAGFKDSRERKAVG